MPTSLHVIRLAGIWDIADGVSPSLDRAAQENARSPARAKAALAWTKVRLDRLETEGLPFPPGVCRRFFNRPTNLAVDQPVYLEWIGLRHAASIRLNGLFVLESAGGAETIRVRVDDRLAERNELHLVPLRREGDPATDAEDRQPIWPFRDCRLLIDEGDSS